MVSRLAFGPVLVLVLSAFLAACAGDPEPPPAPDPGLDRVLERLGALEQRMERLEQRVSAIPSRAPEPSRGRDPAPAPSAGDVATGQVDRIAYIGDDGNLYTVKPSGAGRKQLTGLTAASAGSSGDEISFWPTWSPDGRTLAYSEARRAAGETAYSVALMTLDLSTGKKRELYANPPVAAPIIAPGTPHYMSWSPDSRHLAFIAMEDEGMVLRVSTLDSPED